MGVGVMFTSLAVVSGPREEQAGVCLISSVAAAAEVTGLYDQSD